MKRKILLIVILAAAFLTTLVSRKNLDKSLLGVYIDDKYQEKIPTKDDGYYVEKVTCDNGASGTWDYTNWGLFTTNLTKKSKCNIYFKDSAVYDKSDNNFTAVLKNGASIKTDDNNIKYFSFDGEDDYIELPTLPANINWADGFTVEFKAQWLAFKNWSRIFDFGNGAYSDNIVVAQLITEDVLVLGGLNGITNTTNETNLISNAGLANLNEFKIEFLKTTDGYQIKTYQNGDLVSTMGRTSSQGFRNIERTTNYIGKSNWVADKYFCGNIYYLKITDSAGKIILWYEP